MAATVAAQLATLVEAVHQLKERSEEDREDRRKYHEKLSSELDAERRSSEAYQASVQLELAKLTSGQAHLINRVEAIEPVATMVMSIKAKIAGAVVVLGLIGSVVIWTLLYFRDYLTRAILQ